MANPENSFTKDPSAELDYQWNWATWLGADTISAATVTLPAGLAFETSAPHPLGYTNTTTAVTAWLKSGTAGTDYTVVCQITTAGGRKDERSIVIRCMNR